MSGLKLYKSYNFTSKDPVIDELRTLIETENRSRMTRHMLQSIQDNGGPTIAAMNGWFFGKTRRPQSATIEACGRAIGWRRGWVKMNGKKKR